VPALDDAQIDNPTIGEHQETDGGYNGCASGLVDLPRLVLAAKLHKPFKGIKMNGGSEASQ